MNNTVKTFTLIAITLAKAKKYSNSKNDYIAWRGLHLLKAAQKAGTKYPGGSLKKDRILQIKKELNYISQLACMKDDPKKISENLAFILIGVDEILTHTRNPVTKKLFNDIANKACWLNSLVDPKLNQNAHYIRADHGYNKWINS